MLKTCTIAFFEFLHPIMPALWTGLFPDHVGMNMSASVLRKTAGQQKLLAVLALALRDDVNLFVKLWQNNKKSGIARYFYDLFVVGVPLLVSGWQSLRMGDSLFLHCSIAALIPLLWCMHHPHYVWGAFIQLSVVYAEGWREEAERVLGLWSAECGEICLSYLADYIGSQRNLYDNPDALRTHLLNFKEYISSRKYFDSVLLSSTHRRDACVVKPDCLLVKNARAFIAKLVACLYDNYTMKLPKMLYSYMGWTGCMEDAFASCVGRTHRFVRDATVPEVNYAVLYPYRWAPDAST